MVFKNKQVFGGRKRFSAKAVITSIPTKKKLPPLLAEYDLGLFVDDLRRMSDTGLPKAKEWKAFKTYHEFAEYIEDVHIKLEVKPKTVFISWITFWMISADDRMVMTVCSCAICSVMKSPSRLTYVAILLTLKRMTTNMIFGTTPFRSNAGMHY